MPLEAPLYHTPKDIARLLRISHRTVNRWIEEGCLPAHELRPHTRRISADQLHDFLAAHELTPDAVTTPLHTPVEIAQRLRVSSLTVYRLIADGKLQAHRLGPRLLRVTQANLDIFMNGNCRG
jgi:excisionase family DNA binding protein